MPTPTPVNDSRWLTHDAIYKAIRFGSGDTLRAYASECDAVGADSLAEELRGYADQRGRDAVDAAEHQAHAEAELRRAVRSVNRCVRSAQYREPHGTTSREALDAAVRDLRLVARLVRFEL